MNTLKKTKSKAIFFLALFSTLSLSGCQSLSKQEAGAGIGAVLGIALGSQIGDGRGRVIATALGGLLGGLIGSEIGKHLDEKDRAALMSKSNEILNKDGAQSGTWKSNHSGASARIETSQSKVTKNKVAVVKHKKVDTSPSLTNIGKTYVTKSSSNIRHKPSKSGQVISGLKKGERFNAIGQTRSGWVLVSKNNITLGYIHGGLVKPYQKSQETTKKPSRDNAIRLDDISDADIQQTKSASTSGINLDKLDLEETTISTATVCKTVNLDVKSDKGNNTEKFEACKSGDGAWEII
ncbi:SH3 domain-containing protein [Ostreibacterium oceani]|uniref:SH3 domain-containing protein n=1 Tax=Ostreibacterium oceani TaxID=2654998 RepID=A0A6N7EX70_9GAMM|nr:SH3 domain-containing protein [Ostreibacterium oceani]MPV86130.1 SH3 domain-containing protein [Ostreibacterium oceani]